jgi:hypothetical protein
MACDLLWINVYSYDVEAAGSQRRSHAGAQFA